MRFLLLWILVFVFSCEDKTKTVRVTEQANIDPIIVPPGTPTNDAVFPQPDGFPPVQSRDPRFIGFDNIEQFQLADIQTLDESERLNTRYLILSDKFNEGADANRLQNFTAGVNKALNSASTEREIELATPVDNTQSVLRIDIRDFGWTPAIWRSIENSDPFGIVSFTQRGALIRQLTGANQPFMHAVNLSNIIHNGDLYYEIMGVDENLQQFLIDQGVEVQREFDEFDDELFMVGISQSEIALQKTRIFQRNDGRFGPMWRTYDTVLGAFDPTKNAFDFPFPVEARSEKVFSDDASEFIWVLENGCLGMSLFNAAGQRESFAPTNIVFDTSSRGLDPTIRNSLSCFGCHSQGFIPAVDQVNPKVQSDPAFDAVDRDKAQRYYGRVAATAAIFRQDNNDYARRCLEPMRISPANTDPLNNLVDTIRYEMNLKQVASFLFLREEDFRLGLESSIRGKAQIGQLLTGGTVSAEQLTITLPILIEDLRLFQDPLGR